MCRVLCGDKFSAPLGEYQGTQLLDFMLSARLGSLRNRQTFLLSACTVRVSTGSERVSVLTPHPRQHLVRSVFWILALLVGVWWCLTAALTRSSLLT